MIGEVVKIINDRNDKYSYKRVIFKLTDGSWAKTDIVVKDRQTGKPFRNYRCWKPLLKVGKAVGGLRFISPEKIDADSLVYDWELWRPRSSDEMVRAGVI